VPPKVACASSRLTSDFSAEEAAVRLSEQFGRKVASADEAREIMKIGVWYDSVDETLQNSVCRRTARRRARLHGLGDRRKEERRPLDVRFASDGLLHGPARGGTCVAFDRRAPIRGRGRRGIPGRVHPKRSYAPSFTVVRRCVQDLISWSDVLCQHSVSIGRPKRLSVGSAEGA
jgi:hypothetical protein